MSRKASTRLLAEIQHRRIPQYFEAVQEMMGAYLAVNGSRMDDARLKVGDVVRETIGRSEVIGASLALEAATRGANFAAASPVLPRVTFIEAVEELAERIPVPLQRAAGRTAEQIAQIYSEQNAIAFSRATERAVVDRAQSIIAQAVFEGTPEAEAVDKLMRGSSTTPLTADWSRAYSQAAFRTNVNTGISAGRFRQARDPDVRQVIPALRFDAVGDADTRPNHMAADGVILAVDDPGWDEIAPPLGFNCRCTASFVNRAQLKRMGRIGADGSLRASRIPARAGPDKGFTHFRPDRFTSTMVL